MNENNQQNCIEQAKQGNPAAIAELYNRYWRAARAAAYGVTAEINLAEDAASEAFYTAIKSLQDLKDKNRFGPWLHTIVIRTARRISKARSKENNIEPQRQSDTRPPSPSSRLEQQELANLIHEAVGTLSESLREAISVFYFEGYNLKEAAHFLDVPEGTLKRRLHDGRRRLRDAVEQISKGAKPINPQREQILRQLNEALNEGSDFEDLYKIMRQALRLRPVPNELLKKVAQRHWADKKKKLSKPMPPEKERMLRETMTRIYSHSDRAKDPNHPIGVAANAIHAELSEFQPWQVDFTQIDLNQMTRNIFEGNEKAFLCLLPPELIESTHRAYIYPMRAFLLLDEDGSFCTSYELMQKKDSVDAFKAQIKEGKRLSDTLILLWKQLESLELREIEKLLRNLSTTITPAVPIHFNPYDEPRYRVALRMQLGDNRIPAAIGGVLNSRPEIYGTGKTASVTIYLEPWAEVQSGQTIELDGLSSILDLIRKNQTNKKIE